MRRFIGIIIPAVFFALIVLFTVNGQLAYYVPVFYLGLSLIAFGLYVWDKRAAQEGRRRIPERNLHLVALLGGWPGALCAQQQLRHKSQKMSFRIVLWLCVMANCGLLILLHKAI